MEIDKNYNISVKMCTKCKQLLSLNKYNSSFANNDGKQSWCKKCTNKANKLRIQKRKQEILNKEKNKKVEQVEQVTHKYCTNCLEDLSIISFYKNKKTKDGLTSWCKKCMNNLKRHR